MGFPWQRASQKDTSACDQSSPEQQPQQESEQKEEPDQHEQVNPIAAAFGLTVPEVDMLKGLKETSVKFLRNNLGFFSGRVMVACLVLHVAKAGLKRAVKRRRRLRRGVDFATDVLLPGTFFGPVLGITVGVLELMGRIPPLGLVSAAKCAVSSVSLAPAAGAHIITSMARLHGRVRPSPPDLAPPAAAPGIAEPCIPADSPAAAVGMLIGLPVGPPALHTTAT